MKYVFGLLATGVVFLSGCSTGGYPVQQANLDGLVGKDSFAWSPQVAEAAVAPGEVEWLRKDVENEMVGKGYARVPARDAKLLVNTTITTSPVSTDGVNAVVEGSQDASVSPGSGQNFAPGTILISVGDAHTKKILWRGAAVNSVTASQPASSQKTAVRNAVIQVMQEMPSAQ